VAAFAEALGVEEGQGSDTADFVVNELESHPEERAYLGSSFPFVRRCLSLYADGHITGELSTRALTRSKGTHDTKDPFPAPIAIARELFNVDAERNCVHVVLNIEGPGVNYQHGDHVGVWPGNPDIEVNRLLCALGLYDEKNTVTSVESLDSALAEAPFPVLPLISPSHIVMPRSWPLPEISKLSINDESGADPTTGCFTNSSFLILSLVLVRSPPPRLHLPNAPFQFSRPMGAVDSSSGFCQARSNPHCRRVDQGRDRRVHPTR